MISHIAELVRHALATIFIFGSAMLALSIPLQDLSSRDLVPLLIFAAAYFLFVLVAMASTHFAGRATARKTLLLGLLFYAIASLVVGFAELQIPRRALIAGFGSILLMLLINAIADRWSRAKLAAVTMALIALLAVGFGSDIARLENLALKNQISDKRNISTALYRTTLSQYRNAVKVPEFLSKSGSLEEARWGGALAIFGDRYLLGTGDGSLFVFDWNPHSDKLQFDRLDLRVPINSEDFIDAVDASVDRRTFRVADVLVQQRGINTRIYASYHVWNPHDRCSTMRISYAESTIARFSAHGPIAKWHDIFETTPCLPLKDRAAQFGGLQNGGRMALFGANELLVTIGDHQFDGYYSTDALAQATDNSYGKIFRIDLANGGVHRVSLGHRNPQGLFVDSHGTIWSTEHGPKGGDELNIIVENGNYGWPLVTFGSAYDKTTWPLSTTPGRHDGFIAPVYAWIPSIGVSNLLRINGRAFDLWRDDLIVASLTGRALWRLRVIDGRVAYSEEIPIRCRVRDVLETRGGELLLWCDDENSILALAPAEASDDGEVQFVQCEGCHSITENRIHGIGPDLRGIKGRKIASLAGFQYSAALKNVGGKKWTASALDKFLKHPQKFAPGNAMEFEGIEEDQNRAALIEYLLTIKP